MKKAPFSQPSKYFEQLTEQQQAVKDLIHSIKEEHREAIVADDSLKLDFNNVLHKYKKCRS